MTAAGRPARPGPARRRCLAGLLATLAALPLLLGLALPTSAAVRQAGTAPSAEGDDPALPVALTVTLLEPKAPRPGAILRVRGTVRNRGAVPLTDVRVRVRVSDVPIGSRTALAEVARDTGAFGRSVRSSEQTVAPLLAPRQILPFALSVPVDDLGLDATGLYPFGVDARVRGSSGTEIAGRLRTFLPFLATDGRLVPTPLAWVWPLIATPHQGPDGAFVDDELAAQLGPGGRLSTLAAIAADYRRRPSAAITLAVDPALLDGAAVMARGYLVRAPGQPARPGAGAAAAAAWLADVRAAAHGTPLIALPYADPDLVALTRAGAGQEVRLALDLGRTLTAQLLPDAAPTGVLWPPGGLVDQATLDQLAGVGVSTLVLVGRALPLQDPPTYTPRAVADLSTAGAVMSATVADSGLSGLVGGVPGRATPPSAGALRLAEQRFLAETFLITLERPGIARPVVVTAPRHWDPAPAYARAVLTDTASVPWLRPVSVPDVAADPGPRADRAGLTYPAGVIGTELPRDYLRSVASVRTGTRDLEAVVDNPRDPLTPDLQRATFRLESAAWRDDAATAARLQRLAAARVHDLKGRVRITTSGLITLTSRSGKIPLTVANGLSRPVELQVRMSSNQARVVVRDSPVRRIEPGHSIQLLAEYESRTAGVFPVYAELYTPDGRLYSAPVKILVRSTAYGALALGITGGALGVLLVAVTVRLGRRAWRASRRRSSPRPAG